jgi:hypothetical protein
MKKIEKSNQKLGENGRVVSQTLTLGPKHDRIQA